MAGISFSGEPYPSSIHTCAFIVGLVAEFTIVPISQSDKLRRGGAALVSCPGHPESKEAAAPFQASLPVEFWKGRAGQTCFWFPTSVLGRL